MGLLPNLLPAKFNCPEIKNFNNAQSMIDTKFAIYGNIVFRKRLS